LWKCMGSELKMSTSFCPKWMDKPRRWGWRSNNS
jgi:hypothetical protein